MGGSTLADTLVADVTMTYNFKRYRAFYRFMTLRAHKGIWVLIVGVPVVCVAVAVYNVFHTGANFLLVGAIMLIYVALLLLQFMRPGRAYKNFAARMPDSLRFIFFTNQLHVVNTRNGKANDNWMEYDEIRTPYESKGAFYLQRTDKKTYILPKDCMDQEDIDALRGFFRERFGARFKGGHRV